MARVEARLVRRSLQKYNKELVVGWEQRRIDIEDAGGRDHMILKMDRVWRIKEKEESKMALDFVFS